MAGFVDQAIAGLPGAEASLVEARDLAGTKAGILGHPDAADPALLVPPPSLVAQLRRVLAEHAAREAALAGLPRRATEQQLRLDEADRAIAALPPPEDLQHLEELLAEIRRDGERLVRGLAEREVELASASDALRASRGAFDAAEAEWGLLSGRSGAIAGPGSRRFSVC